MYPGHFFNPMEYCGCKFWPIGDAGRPHGRLPYWK